MKDSREGKKADRQTNLTNIRITEVFCPCHFPDYAPFLKNHFFLFFRNRLKSPKLLNRVEVVEFDAKSKDKVKKVRFVDRKEVVDSNVQVSLG
jgi:hypothetical protein